MKLETSAVATILVIIFAIVGGVLVIIGAVTDGVDPSVRLTFNQYLEGMVVAIGGLAIGRGLDKHVRGA